MTRVRERVVAFVAGAILLFFAGGTLLGIFGGGTAFLIRFGKSNSLSSQGAAAMWIFLIAGTELPQLLRKSLYIRNQLLCLAAWEFLVACLIEAESFGIGRPSEVVFTIAVSVLALYSVVALFRPPDVFGGSG